MSKIVKEVRMECLVFGRTDGTILESKPLTYNSHIEVPNPDAMLSDHNPHWADLEF